MSRITYLIGAGASFNALPIVEKIPERLAGFITEMESDYLRIGVGHYEDLSISGLQEPISEYQNRMIQNLKWLHGESKKNASIDTLAKKLFLKGDSKLVDLKIGLSLFFAFEQIKNEPEPRYDAFFASILDSNLKLPDRLKILSWNYDSQIEISYSGFCDSDDIRLCSQRLGVYTKSDNDPPGAINIFKINGTTGYRPQTEKHHKLFLKTKKATVDLNLAHSLICLVLK